LTTLFMLPSSSEEVRLLKILKCLINFYSSWKRCFRLHQLLFCNKSIEWKSNCFNSLRHLAHCRRHSSKNCPSMRQRDYKQGKNNACCSR
jgi:hypothetical protein